MDTLKKATEINRNNTLKMYTELWNKLKYLIRSITNISGDYDKKYFKIKFNSDDNVPLNEIKLKLHDLTVVASSAFQEDKKYYPQVFLYECLYEFWMLEYDKANALEGLMLMRQMHQRNAVFM